MVITLLLLACLFAYLIIGFMLTGFVFSQFPFVDYGLHFIYLWPVVLFTCFSFYSLLLTGPVFITMGWLLWTSLP